MQVTTYYCILHILTFIKGDEFALSFIQRLENIMMTKVRIAAEWDFGCTSQLWKFTQFWTKVQIKKHPNHRMYYFVATFLRNLNVCCYGNITSYYFKCKPPSLEEYLRIN